MDLIYVLSLEGNKYYIGKSSNINQRYRQHLDGKGCKWTSTHKPIKIVEVKEIMSIFDEDNTTKEYMMKYGIENVRGGTYSSIEISEDVIKVLTREFTHNNDLCLSCGLEGHYANECQVSPIMEFGRYTGMKVINVIKKDPNYLKWLMTQKAYEKNLKNYEEIKNFLNIVHKK